jgi:hypothetical protein
MLEFHNCPGRLGFGLRCFFLSLVRGGDYPSPLFKALNVGVPDVFGWESVQYE